MTSYAKLDYYYRHRLRRRAQRLRWDRSFICQECGGAGGWREVILDDGTGPWEVCGWCWGEGRVLAWERGYWLRLKRAMKRELPPRSGDGGPR